MLLRVLAPKRYPATASMVLTTSGSGVITSLKPVLYRYSSRGGLLEERTYARARGYLRGRVFPGSTDGICATDERLPAGPGDAVVGSERQAHHLHSYSGRQRLARPD